MNGNLNTNKIAVYTIVIVGILIGSIYAFPFFLKDKDQPQQTAKTSINTTRGPAEISLEPSNQELSEGQNFSLYAILDSKQKDVTGIDISLNFDPQSFEVVSIEPQEEITKNLNQTIFNKFDNSIGTLNYVIYTLDKEMAVEGLALEVLKVNLKVKKDTPAGAHEITFSPNTAASAASEGINIISKLGSARIEVL